MERSYSYPSHIVSLLGLLLSSQALFFNYQNMASETISAGLENHIEYAARERSPMALVRATHQLESLGLLTCVFVEELQPRPSVLMDMSQSQRCSGNRDWLLEGVKKDIRIRIGVENVYRLQFRINNPKAFYISLWVVRIAILGGYFALVFGVRSRIRARELKKDLEKRQLETITHLAAQVAHDIRSPLAALDNMVSKTKELPEADRILTRTAINRIKDIANNLIEKNRELKSSSTSQGSSISSVTSEPHSIQLLFSLIDPLITEKRMQYRSRIGIEIDARLDAGAYGLFAKIQPTEFKRVLSNLINNCVEALGDSGRITLLAAHARNQITVSISDNGKGIPPEVLARLGARGETHGKPGGSGLGLFHARSTVESWGGKLEIASTLAPHSDHGTTVTLTLPQAPPPAWFVSELTLNDSGIVVVLDDDPSIHRIWQGRFDSLRLSEKGVLVHHFSTPKEIKDFVKNNLHRQNIVYLTDYELLGHKENGLDLIDELGVGTQSILVTSRFEEKHVAERAAKLKVRLIPKSMAAFVPIAIAKPLERFDAILIDDDVELIHSTWTYAARDKKLKFRCYATKEAFLADAENIHRDTPLYIDANLGNGVTGESVARASEALGFKTMHLATGYEPDEFAHLLAPKGPFVSIQGKDPPWGNS